MSHEQSWELPWLDFSLDDFLSAHLPQANQSNDGILYELDTQARDEGGAPAEPHTWDPFEHRVHSPYEECRSPFLDGFAASERSSEEQNEPSLCTDESAAEQSEAPLQAESRSRSLSNAVASSNISKYRKLSDTGRLPNLANRLKALVQPIARRGPISVPRETLPPKKISIPLPSACARPALPLPNRGSGSSLEMALARRVDAAMRPRLGTVARFVTTVPSRLGEDGLQRMLVALAQAVAMDDTDTAREVMKELGVLANPLQGPMQRLSYYMIMALQARVKGRGAPLARKPANFTDTEYARTMEEMAYQTPYVHYCIGGPLSLVADALFGRPKVHIMVNVIEGCLFMTTYWYNLLKKLASHPKAPPHVRLTCVGRPEFSHRAMVAGGAEISRQAHLLGISFEFRAVPGPMEHVYCPASPVEIFEDEALAIVFILRLQELADASVLRYNPREQVMKVIREWNPCIVVQTDLEFDLNSIFFMARFRECVRFLAIFFDSFEAGYPKESQYREMYEKYNLAGDAYDIVACDGLDRVLRSEPLRHWRQRWTRARFRMMPMTLTQRQKFRGLVKGPNFSEEFDVETCCEGGVALTWKGEPVIHTVVWGIME